MTSRKKTPSINHKSIERFEARAAPPEQASSVSDGSVAMKARELLRSGTYGPETMKALGQAFDQVWEVIAPEYDPHDAHAIDVARQSLAHKIITMAAAHGRDVAAIKNAALNAMASGKRPTISN